MTLLENLYKLISQIRRDSARAYLTGIARDNLQHFPQMCCYSFDDISAEINIDGRLDRCALEALVNIIPNQAKGRAILDIGANIGNHALVFSDIAKHVIAFEPHPVTFKLLELNARNHENVTPVNVGASDVSAQLRAVSPARNRGATAISDRKVGLGEESWTFTVEPLDERDDIKGADVALMKLDVEGHEAHALRGLVNTIDKNKPIIVIEQNPDAIINGTSEALEIIKSCGYNYLYSIDVTTPWSTPQALPAVFRKTGRVIESLIFGPRNFTAIITPVSRLEKRTYPMLIASFESLNFAPYAAEA